MKCARLWQKRKRKATPGERVFTALKNKKGVTGAACHSLVVLAFTI
jgi:hypothetical protein